MVTVVEEPPRRIRCSNCGQLLEYTLDDVEEEGDLPRFFIRFIKCPSCQTDVIVDSN